MNENNRKLVGELDAAEVLMRKARMTINGIKRDGRHEDVPGLAKNLEAALTAMRAALDAIADAQEAVEMDVP